MAEQEILKVEPVEAIAHFRGKGHHVGFDWRDTDAAEHLRSFTVAKAMRLDMLQDIRGAVDRALADGLSFRQFQNELEPLLRARGWWGRQPMTDSLTGETRIVQLGSPRRLRIIYDTNLRMAHAKGRWERIERAAKARPWLRYLAIQDARTRPDHMAWHGTVLRWDHPFWETHYPPNGWRCRCIVQQLSDDDLADFGVEPSGGPPPGSGETRPWTNRRTGATVQVPRGIDPGFQHNVGLVGQAKPAQTQLAEKIAAAPPPLAKVAEAKELDDWIALGREERERLVGAAGGPYKSGFSDRFQASLRAELRERRDAGTATARVSGDPGAVDRVREAAGRLPRSWVERTNAIPLTAEAGAFRAGYTSPIAAGAPGRLGLSENPSAALHEYLHHIQQADPELDAIFVALHRRRTAGEKLVPVIVQIPEMLGRRDKYIDPYTGREYDIPGIAEGPMEVMTTSIEQVLDRPHGLNQLGKLAANDPEMLDLVLGLLLHYDPA